MREGMGKEAYTMDTPQKTMKTANTTFAVKTRRSQNFSTRQTKGMIINLAICKARSHLSTWIMD